MFNCANLCRTQGTNRLDPDEQAARCCALPGYDTRKWQPEPDALIQIHMGAPPRYDLEGVRGDWMKPHEEVSVYGCPGAMYRAPFMDSIARYRRRRDGNGGRIENVELTRCDIPLVHEALMYLEAEEDLAYSAQLEERDAAADTED